MKLVVTFGRGDALRAKQSLAEAGIRHTQQRVTTAYVELLHFFVEDVDYERAADLLEELEHTPAGEVDQGDIPACPGCGQEGLARHRREVRGVMKHGLFCPCSGENPVAFRDPATRRGRITECPHCHWLVVPSQSGNCPWCSRDVNGDVAIRRGMRLIVVRENQVFPAVCFNCAQPARKRIRVSNEDAGAALARNLFEHLLPWGKLFTAMVNAERDPFSRFRLPICDACRSRHVKAQVQPHTLEEGEIRVVVHERFRELAMRG